MFKYNKINFKPYLFLLPLFNGFFHQIFHGNNQFPDAGAIICAGHSMLDHVSPYFPGNTCSAISHSPFVYPPLAAWGGALIQFSIGETGATMVYGFVYIIVFIFIMRRLLKDDVYLSLRMLFLIIFSSRALLSGNISLVFHGIIFYLSLLEGAYSFLLWPAVVGFSAIKPTFIVYVVLFLFQKKPFRTCAFMTASAAFAVFMMMTLNYLAFHEYFLEWLSVLYTVHSGSFIPGHSIMAILNMVGVHSSKSQILIFVPFAAALVFAGLVIKKYSNLTEIESVMIGISICLLLSPRLLDYDEYTLPFGLAILLNSFRLVPWPDATVSKRLMIAVWAAILLTGGFRGGIILYLFAVTLVFLLAAQMIAQARKSGRLATRHDWLMLLE